MFDLIILGGGPAGYRAAERAGQTGLQTLLIEKRALGGVCLNEGCIPSKTLLYSAKIYDFAKGGGVKYGISCDNARLDHAAVLKRKNKVVRTLVAGIAAQMKQHKVTVAEGCGVIEGREADGFAVRVGDERHLGKRLLIATGSEAAKPPIPGLEECFAQGFVLTNREILSLDHIPQRLVIVGGGVIGLEMASYYGSAGSEVTVIEMLDKIAGPNDREISSLLQKNYEKKGVRFHLNARVTTFASGSVSFEKDGQAHTIECDKALVSIGRRPSSEGIGLESIGVLTDRGAVVTDEEMKTNVPGVWAAGDINGRSMLAHTAYREAEVAVNVMTGRKDVMRYTAIPSVIYTNPEVAAIGETAESAQAAGLTVQEVKLPMRFSGRYVAEHEGGDGICKLIVEEGTRRIVGAHMIANPASELIWGLAPLIEREMRPEEIQRFVFPHPTVGEVFRDAVFMTE